MPTQAFNSVIGNAVAQRKKLQVIRQATGLEPNANLKQVAPSPSAGPANNPGAAQQVVSQEPEFDPTTHVLAPDKQSKMLEHIQGWIDENHNGVDDRQEGAAMQGNASAPPANMDNEHVPPGAQAALAPIAEFYKQNGRMPTSEELRNQATANLLQAQLGRPPTPTEIQIYQQKPEKGLAGGR